MMALAITVVNTARSLVSRVTALCALILAAPALAAAPPIGADVLALAHRVDDWAPQFALCDQGEALGCKLASDGLKRLSADAAQTLIDAASPACSGGDQQACWVRAVGLAALIKPEAGHEAQRRVELAEAAALFDTACAKGTITACRSLAQATLRGQGVDKDIMRGMDLLDQACTGGAGAACRDLANLTMEPRRARDLRLAACRLHDPIGCDMVAFMLEHRSASEIGWDGPPAVPDLYRFACDGGDGWACRSLGEHYEQGEGIDTDDTLAASYFRKGCDAGDAIGCTRYGENLRDGQGVAVDRAAALELFVRSCAGYVPACADQAAMLNTNRADPASLRTALTVYARLCATWSEGDPCGHYLALRSRLYAMGQAIGAQAPILPAAARDRPMPTYPTTALVNHESGVSSASFTVKPDGTTANCTATGAGGTLDAATCEEFVARLRYIPGTDAAGHPAETPVTTTIRWVLPR